MATAWDLGITLFDTARSYGFGEAEAVLGEFLRGKRDRAVVATKYGIPPQRQSALKRIIIPVARAALRVPGVRGLKRGRGSLEVTFGQFTVTGLRKSIETSLRELRTDYIDVLFLHEATKESMHRHDLMAELDSLVQQGKVLRVGLYAGADVVADGLASGPATLTAMQFGGNFLDPSASRIMQQNPRGMFLIANHPFGSEKRVAATKAVLAAMSGDGTVPAELRDKLRGDDWQRTLEVIFGVLLDGNCTHALVFSMMRNDHLCANARAIENNRFTGAELAFIRGRFLDSSLSMQVE
jgi:aryl-alcohol dehydrogenase-like predicted oxidoreductase